MMIDPKIDTLGIGSVDFSVTIHTASKGERIEARIALIFFF